MKKVCFILSASNTKGSNGTFIELLDSLDRNRFKPYVILPANGPIVHQLEIRDIPFKIFYYKWWMHVENSPKWKWAARFIINFVALPRICCQVLKWRCNIIYTNTIVINVGLFAAIILRKPHIFHIHEFGYADHKLIFDFWKNFSLKVANKFTSYFICVSQAIADEYLAFIEKNKLKVVYQSVKLPNETSNRFDFKKHNFQCVIVGRLAEGKGQEDAIRAIGILREEGLDVGLWIVGDGDLKYKKYLEKIVEENDIGENIVFCGWHDNPLLFIKKADVTLICSRCEGFGRVTVEAMLCGKPVIGADSGGTREIIKDGHNGLLYPPRNFLELSQKIRRLMFDPQKRKKLAKIAQSEAIRKFQQKSYGKEIGEIIGSIVRF